jgi:aconitate hydratase
VRVRILRANGAVEAIAAVAAVETQLEAELLRAGGVIPSTLQRMLRANPAARVQRGGL